MERNVVLIITSLFCIRLKTCELMCVVLAINLAIRGITARTLMAMDTITETSTMKRIWTISPVLFMTSDCMNGMKTHTLVSQPFTLYSIALFSFNREFCRNCVSSTLVALHAKQMNYFKRVRCLN